MFLMLKTSKIFACGADFLVFALSFQSKNYFLVHLARRRRKIFIVTYIFKKNTTKIWVKKMWRKNIFLHLSKTSKNAIFGETKIAG